MSPARIGRFLLVLSPTLVILGAVGWYASRHWTRPPAPGPADAGRLVVVAVFDQMRGDYLDRWAAAFGPDGFQQMKADGVWYSNAMLPYACSATGPGHASISTGAPPSAHGIIENEWFDRGRGAMVQAWTTDERFERVPPAEAKEALPDGFHARSQ
jgi:predicted AlkP superfamily pyrophosphatase or phosphodiesterase